MVDSSSANAHDYEKELMTDKKVHLKEQKFRLFRRQEILFGLICGRRRLGTALLFRAFYRVINLTAMDRNLFRSLYAQTDLVASNLDDNDCNVVIDDDTFVLLSRQN